MLRTDGSADARPTAHRLNKVVMCSIYHLLHSYVADATSRPALFRCALRAVRADLCAARCELCACRCTLLQMRRLAMRFCCALYVVRFDLFAVCYALCNVRSALCDVRCAF